MTSGDILQHNCEPVSYITKSVQLPQGLGFYLLYKEPSNGHAHNDNLEHVIATGLL